jgi:hypothetical protein
MHIEVVSSEADQDWRNADNRGKPRPAPNHEFRPGDDRDEAKHAPCQRAHYLRRIEGERSNAFKRRLDRIDVVPREILCKLSDQPGLQRVMKWRRISPSVLESAITNSCAMPPARTCRLRWSAAAKLSSFNRS